MENLNLEPRKVFDCFALVNKVPRPSKKEEKMIAFLKEYGESLGLETNVDEVGNVIIKKPAVPQQLYKATWIWFAKRTPMWILIL